MAPPPAPPPPPARAAWSRWKVIALVLAAIGVFAFAYWRVLDVFREETAQRQLRYTPGSGEGPDYVRAQVSVSQIDPQRGVIGLRVKLVPRGVYTERGYRPNRLLRLRVNGYQGPVEYVFKAKRRMGSIEATLLLHGGDVGDYPRDRYRANLGLELDEGPSVKTADGKKVRSPRVPIRIAFEGSLQGFRLTSRLSERSKDGYVIVRMDLERSYGSTLFAFIVMAILAVLTCMVLAVLVHTLVSGKRPETGFFGWMGGMLFAFPAIRSALPGSPPIGSFIDYLVFFWAEGFVALALVITVTLWLLRPAPPAPPLPTAAPVPEPAGPTSRDLPRSL